jgi:hypothetical protein
VKQQIELDWPNNPPPGDQRLVYAGKLLQDNSRLKEVLRIEDLTQPFIVHLVRVPVLSLVHMKLDYPAGLPDFYRSKHAKTGNIYQMTTNYTKRS